MSLRISKLTNKGAEDDEADHVNTEENEIVNVGDRPVGAVAEAVHFHHHPEMVLLLIH